MRSTNGSRTSRKRSLNSLASRTGAGEDTILSSPVFSAGRSESRNGGSCPTGTCPLS